MEEIKREKGQNVRKMIAELSTKGFSVCTLEEATHVILGCKAYFGKYPPKRYYLKLEKKPADCFSALESLLDGKYSKFDCVDR